MNIDKTKDETIKALLKDIKFYDKLLNNVFNWCGKDSLLYWAITRNKPSGLSNLLKGEQT